MAGFWEIKKISDLGLAYQVPYNSIMSIYVETVKDVTDLKDQGWWLCNGTNGTPNLVGQFIRGGTPGSNVDGTQIPATANTEDHTLTLAQMPNHSHDTNDHHKSNMGPGSTLYIKWGKSGAYPEAHNTFGVGSSTAHSHDMDPTPDHTYIGFFMFKGVAN
jgi:hypothetical protein